MTDTGLRVIIAGADTEQVELLSEVMSGIGRWEIVLATDNYPNASSLPMMLRVYSPQAFFFAVDDWERALDARADLKQLNNHMPVIGFGQSLSTETMLDVLRAGFADYVPLVEGSTPDLDAVADRLLERLREIPLQFDSVGKLYSFLPAKPGVGTSTVALHTCGMLAQRTGTDVLLADLDFNNGLIAFMSKMPEDISPHDLFDKATAFDESIWEQMVHHKDQLHLFAPRTGESDFRIEPSKIEAVMAFARTLYPFVCVDLSGNMEKYSTALLRRSDRIFLVCTPETPALHLARTRCRVLRNLGMIDRVRLILNRWHRGSVLSLTNIEKLLGTPVWETIPNEYGPVHQALMNGSPLNPRSKLGKSFSHMAGRLSITDGDTSKKSAIVTRITKTTGLGRLFRRSDGDPGQTTVDLDNLSQAVGNSPVFRGEATKPVK
ncbi:MAG: hypothetical protein GY953_40865 [bacterium]|nr:hypothetical protein [bacterium]